jgi:hypothetical protein
VKAIVIAQPTKRKRPDPTPAWRLYQGSQQQLVQAGLGPIWERYGFRQMIDEVILSPWHGPVEPDQVLQPYDFSWKGRPRAEVAEMVRSTALVERLQERVRGYDLVIVLLSKVYLSPLRLAEWVPGTAPQRWLYFASGAGLPFLPVAPNVRLVRAGTPEARQAGVKVLDIKSYLFCQLCERTLAKGVGALTETWQEAEPIRENP